MGAAVCVRWLMLGRADRARVSGYWCSEMMLVVLYGRWCVGGGARKEEVIELLCLPGYDADAALRSAHGKQQQPAEFRQP